MSELLESWGSVSLCWDTWREEYTEQIRVREENGKKPHLVKDDKWFRTKLPGIINGRSQPHITQPELSRIMRFKLARGSWRPRLQNFVDQADNEEVVSLSTIAFQDFDPDDYEATLKSSIKTLSTLRGVGPATASLILSAYTDAIPFFADEAYKTVFPGEKIKYDLRGYLSFSVEIREMKTKTSARSISNIFWACEHKKNPTKIKKSKKKTTKVKPKTKKKRTSKKAAKKATKQKKL